MQVLWYSSEATLVRKKNRELPRAQLSGQFVGTPA
jgi:hypothetical protein